jgi:integrase
LKYLHEYRDRHGQVRRYFRRNGTSIPLPGEPGTEEFAKAYLAAFQGQKSQEAPAGPGSIAAAVTGYFGSTAFSGFAAETQKMRRNILRRFAEKHGTKTVANLQPRHIDAILAEKAATPPAQKNLLKTLRAFLDYCISVQLRRDNPTKGIKVSVAKSAGFLTWDEHHIEQFEAAHAIGTRPRLALALVLYTAQRRSDVVKMGRQHVRAGMIRVRQQKTGAELEIPVHPELQAVLDATPSKNMTFLVTAYGKPFSPAGFTNWFREQCNAAGLPRGFSAHGLRKAQCRRLAEAGCSVKEIQSISGHASLSEIENYTRAASQKRMARSAIDTVAAAFKRNG